MRYSLSVSNIMIIYIACDHRGFNLKQFLAQVIKSQGYDLRDLGAERYDHEDDYPDFASRVAENVLQTPGSRGVVICGSGGGVSIAANKYKGIRAFIGLNPDQAKATKLDEDTNVLALASDFISNELAAQITEAWLKAEFSGEERHKRRLQEISDIESKV